MQCNVLILAVCLTVAAADSAGNPLNFLFSRCEQPDAGSDVGGCVRDLLRTALDRDRPKFSSGLKIGDKTVVLEPLEMPKPDPNSQGRSSKVSLTAAQLQGLSEVQLDSVMLTNSTAAVMVVFPELSGEANGKIKYGFIPFRPTVRVRVQRPRMMIGVNWSAPEGQLQLREPTAQLWLEGFNITIDGMTSMGRNMAQAINENHENIIEFMKPSLEAAVVRSIKKLDQEERNAMLRWLEKALS